jgi:hypothetical protein
VCNTGKWDGINTRRAVTPVDLGKREDWVAIEVEDEAVGTPWYSKAN